MTELPVEIHGMTRSAFILRGALAAGSMYGAGAVAPFVSRALAQDNAADIEAVNFALALEGLEVAFYAGALKTAKLSGEVKKLATEFHQHEVVHAATLRQLIEQLGGKPAAAAAGKFKLKSQSEFLRAAVTLEDIGVGAYNGLTPQVKTADIVQAMGTIVQVEARHAAALRFRAGENPAPAAFDPVLTPTQVQAAARKLGGG